MGGMTLMQMLSVKNSASLPVDIQQKNPTLGKLIWKDRVGLMRSDVQVVNRLWWIVAMNLMMTVEMEKEQELFVIVSLGTMMVMKIIAQGLLDHHHLHHQLLSP